MRLLRVEMNELPCVPYFSITFRPLLFGLGGSWWPPSSCRRTVCTRWSVHERICVHDVDMCSPLTHRSVAGMCGHGRDL